MRSLILLLTYSFILSGCGWKVSQRPSFLILAVESLGAEAFLCGEADFEFSEGLGALCSDGVRFSHAYSPSTMSQATLASILTGLYPYEHGVGHNGAVYLSERFETVAEVAREKGYRTAFFSGGPPIWRKSGLDQGFELFEDNISIQWNELFRPVAKNLNLFFEWLTQSAEGRPFFSVVYLPDLQFSQVVTISDLGQERARGYDGQLREINESFAALVQQMKKVRQWDNTNVILVGLNGGTLPSREDEMAPLNLHSDNTQVLLMVKPARKARDAGMNWSIDANVSLVDIGATLYDLLGRGEHGAVQDSQLYAVTLRRALQKPQVDWDKSRYIFLESSWAAWRGVGHTRMAVRQDNLLFINDMRPAIFNSLTDRLETQAIRVEDSAVRNFNEQMLSLFNARGWLPWEGLPSALVQKVKIYSHILKGDISAEELKIRLAHLILQRPWDKQLVGWLARIAIEEEDWAWLSKLGEEHLYPVWSYVGQRNRGQALDLPGDLCWSLLDKKKNIGKNRALCNSAEFLAFADWVHSSPASKSRAILEEKFVRHYNLAEIDELVAGLNFQNGLVWDTVVDSPSEPRLVKLAFALPDYKSFRQIIEQRMKRR